jgi:hypothetical protein
MVTIVIGVVNIFCTHFTHREQIMFEFYGVLLSAIRHTNGSITVYLHEDEMDTRPIMYHSESPSVYAMAGLLALDLDVETEAEMDSLANTLDAYMTFE